MRNPVKHGSQILVKCEFETCAVEMNEIGNDAPHLGPQRRPGSPDDAEGSGPGYYPWQQIGQKFINHNARRARNYLLLQLRAI